MTEVLNENLRLIPGRHRSVPPIYSSESGLVHGKAYRKTLILLSEAPSSAVRKWKCPFGSGQPLRSQPRISFKTDLAEPISASMVASASESRQAQLPMVYLAQD